MQAGTKGYSVVMGCHLRCKVFDSKLSQGPRSDDVKHHEKGRLAGGPFKSDFGLSGVVPHS
jgi:hypothetical protein